MIGVRGTVQVYEEVIENGNAPPITKIFEGVETTIAPTTAEEKVQRSYVKRLKESSKAAELKILLHLSSEVLYQTLCMLQSLSVSLENPGESIDTRRCESEVLKNTSSTNRAVNTAHGATTTSTQATAINSTTINNLSDAVKCVAFLSDTDCPHKGHFARECKAPRNQETGIGRTQEGLYQTLKPPKPNLSFSGLEEFVNEPIVSEPTVKKLVVETSETKASEAKPKAVRKNNGAPIIEDWVFDNEKDDVPQANIEKKTFKPSFANI
ncbi:hypothetical protein Tco_0385582 [Tanacetum coccineum]